MTTNVLKQDIRYLKGVGEQRARLLGKLGVDTVGALLYTFPRDYIDYTSPVELSAAPPDAPAAVRVTILEKRPPARLPGGRLMQKLLAESGSCLLDITYFNNPYTPPKLAVGGSYLLYGRFSGGLTRRETVNPALVGPREAGRLFPVYPATEGLASRTIAGFVQTALTLCGGQLPEPLPPDLLARYGLLPVGQAMQSVHFPRSAAEAAQARRRFAFEQVLELGLGLSYLKRRTAREAGPAFSCADPSPFWQSLPFSPTGAQRRCSGEISRDLAAGLPMNRLLQGDVGSGKTAVAAAAVYCAYKSGYQSAFMAPSELLSEQHADTLHQMLSPFGVRTALLTSSVKGARRKSILQALAAGEIDVLIGTHALLGEQVVFSRLGLVVADEQHRFGVDQRAGLSRKGDHPHTLFLSATPIPRSLALVIYGELDISTLNELPAGRKPIRTYLVNSSYRARYLEFVRKNAAAGYGSYIVCPLIGDGETESELESAVGYCAELQRRLPQLRVALLHGRIKPAEKTHIINSFAAGEVDVLVSTTVIEVGIDISHATIMIVENAERYGLSELHQLRGRVGRRGNESSCILVSDSRSRQARARLRFLCDNADGFRIAQYDLEQRGPGQFFGKKQHGLPDLQLSDAFGDGNLLASAYEAAGALLDADPELSHPDHALLRQAVERLFAARGVFN